MCLHQHPHNRSLTMSSLLGSASSKENPLAIFQKSNSTPTMILLSKSFSPGPADIIVYGTIHGGKLKNKHHPGNKRYQAILREVVTKYDRASTRFQKWHLVHRIVTSIIQVNNDNRATASVGSFVAQDEVTGKWYRLVEEKMVHDIVEQNLHCALQRFKKREKVTAIKKVQQQRT